MNCVNPMNANESLRRVVEWYFRHAYGRWEGPNLLPFFCRRDVVGHFAVDPAGIESGDDSALFKLFVCLAMYQARRDIVIMAQQKAYSTSAVRKLSSLSELRSFIRNRHCACLSDAATFDRKCDVQMIDGKANCTFLSNAPCRVKDAGKLLRRMGDMGKLPTSGFLHLWISGGIHQVFLDIEAETSDPGSRAALLVQRISSVFRVGRKLATMYVSALSAPALVGGLGPWYPSVDGYSLSVIDTNVARGINVLQGNQIENSYGARVAWIEQHARNIDLKYFDRELPSYAPRIIQQAVYVFSSSSNRQARGDPCQSDECDLCVPGLCPRGNARD